MLLHLTDITSEPLHGQISRQLREKILSGELPADAPLPSIRELARDQRVSVITVQRAYEDLERAGLTHARRGKGFFVAGLTLQQKQEMAVRNLGDQLEPILAGAAAAGLSYDQIQAVVAYILKEKSV